MFMQIRMHDAFAGDISKRGHGTPDEFVIINHTRLAIIGWFRKLASYGRLLGTSTPFKFNGKSMCFFKH